MMRALPVRVDLGEGFYESPEFGKRRQTVPRSVVSPQKLGFPKSHFVNRSHRPTFVVMRHLMPKVSGGLLAQRVDHPLE